MFLKGWPSYPVLTAIHTDLATGEKGLIETKAFPPDATGRVDWPAVQKWIDQRQGKANMYFLVNHLREPKDNKANRTDLDSIVALHVDVDVRVGEDQVAGIERIIKTFHGYKLPPTVILASGGGAQGFWLLKESLKLDGTKEAAEDAKLYNVQIERDLEGDHCHNIDRIMRLPGTINIPNTVKLKKGRKPAVSYVVEHNADKLYDISQFDKATAVAEAKPKDEPGTDAPKQPKTTKAADKRGDQDAFYEGVPIVPDDTPIATIQDERLKFVDPLVKRIIIDGKVPEDAPQEIKIMTRGTIDMKLVSELVRVGLSNKAIKQVYRLGAISADAAEWPRGFDGDMDRLIEKARELKSDPEFEKWRSKYSVIKIGGKVRILSMVSSEVFPGQLEPELMTPDEFATFHRREKKITYVKERDENGNETGNLKKRTTSMFQYWFNHPQCHQFDGIRFMPYVDEISANGYLNLWRGFTVSPKQGDCSLFKAHILDNICNGNKEYFNYLMQWMAYIVQKRKRTDVIVLLRSREEGTGKSFFAKHFGHILGPAYMEVHNPEHVVGKFNPHLQSLLVINPDEALFAGDHRHRNALWSLTTSDTITVEPKGLGVYAARNYLNFILTTNDERAVDVQSSARRIFALDVAAHRRVDYDYFDAIEEQLNDGGYEGLLHELQMLDLTHFNVRDCPKTDSLERQIMMSRKGIDALVEKICDEARVPCPHYKEPGYTITTSNDRFDGFDNFIDHHPDRELAKMRALVVKRILVRDWGCYSGDAAQRRVKGGDAEIYGTDRIAGLKWPSLEDLRARFIERHGPQVWMVPDAKDWITPEGGNNSAAFSKPNVDGDRLDGIM